MLVLFQFERRALPDTKRSYMNGDINPNSKACDSVMLDVDRPEQIMRDFNTYAAKSGFKDVKLTAIRPQNLKLTW